MAIIKLSAIERRRLSVFFTCFGLAVVAWVIVSLSEDSPYLVKEVMVFKNAPQKRAFHSLQSDTVEVTMRGTGWQMLFSKLSNDSRVLNIDLHTLENRNAIVLNNQLKQINAGRDSTNWIYGFSPDTLYFDFTNRMVKKVPVKPMFAIGYQQRFANSANINIRPDSITVSGPTNRINKIKDWPTDSLKLTNINESYHTRLNLRPVNDGSLVIFPKTVEVRIPVDEYTEKVLEIPVKLINHHYDNVKVFPQKVKIIFTVALNKYAQTDEDDFEAIADLDLWRDHGYTSLPVKFIRKPNFCKIVSIEPRSIDFIVKR